MIPFVLGMCLVGGLVLLDRWQVGEFGVSQPIVACPLLGLVYGDLGAGLFLGTALQLVWVAALPLGREQAMDYQGAGVVAMLGYLFMRRQLHPGADMDGKVLFVTMVFAVLASFLGSQLDAWNKSYNNRLYESGLRARNPGRALFWHLLGLGTGLVRGAVLVLVALIAAYAIGPFVRLLPTFTRAELMALPLGVGIAGAFRMFVRFRRLPWVAAGGAAGGLLWLLLRQ